MLALALSLALAPQAGAPGLEHPNVLIVYTDDQGWGDWGSAGELSRVSTPNMDRLASEGLVFSDAHSPASVCSPSRYGLLTGRYAWRTTHKGGAGGADTPSWIGQRATIASLLREQGYATACIGKWHVGMDIPGEKGARDWSAPVLDGPLSVGFEHFYGIPASMNFGVLTWFEDRHALAPADRWTRKKFPESELVTPPRAYRMMPPYDAERAGPGDIEVAADFVDEEVLARMAQRAVGFLGERAAAEDGRPFLLYLALSSPHLPHCTAPEFQGRSRVGNYGDFLLETDHRIGQVLDALDEHGYAEDTLVLWTSDNGPERNHRDWVELYEHHASGGLRGEKRDVWEGGHRVPFVVRWPRVVAGGRRFDGPVGQVDLYATLAELVGVSPDSEDGVDSLSFLDVLRGEAPERAPREPLVHLGAGGQFAVRVGEWKLVMPKQGEDTASPELYHLASDPAEARDRFAQEPQRAEELERQLTHVVQSGRTRPGARSRNDGAAWWPALSWIPEPAQERPPNVIVVLTDDQGYGDLSLHGNTELETPHMDSLAHAGASFRHFYVQPVCAPTRAEFLTGRYHPRGGVGGVSRGRERLDADEHTIAELFRDAGYATAAFGKWHNGTQAPYHPLARGFEQFYGFTSGHWGHYYDTLLDRDGELTRGSGYCSDDFTDRLLDFVEEESAGPFFAYLGYNTPHSPMQVPERWWDEFSDRELAQLGSDATRQDHEHTRAALAMVANLDWNLGRILTRLRELELEEDTIVVFFSDNGPNGHRYNAGMRGIKGSTDEGGVRSPLLIRWPARLAAGRQVERIAGAIDLMPTLAELAGIELGGERALDGRSLVPLLMDEAGGWSERALFAHWGGRVSVRTDTHRLDHRGRLYDLRADPNQTSDLAGEQPVLAQELRAEVERWRGDVLAELPEAARPLEVGHPALRLTQLPARDAYSAGSIERSSRHPNCSYFTSWSEVGDSVSWPITVRRAGRFRASILYACPEADLGARLGLEFADASLQFSVDAAHDPPVRGAAEDHSPRSESYVKTFAQLELGELELAAQEGLLSLRALEVPGSQALELRMLLLERLD